MLRSSVIFLILLLVLLAPAADGAKAADPVAEVAESLLAPKTRGPNAAELAADESGVARAQPSPIGERLIAGVRDLVHRGGHSVQADAAAIRATWRRLGGLARIDRGAAAGLLGAIAGPLAASLLVAVAGRIALWPVFRRLGRASATRGALATAGLALLKIGLDLGVIILAAIAAAAASGPDTGDSDSRLRTYYVVTFLVTGCLVVAIRAILSPEAPELRMLPMSDATARYWTWRIGIVTVLIGLAEMFVPVALETIATPITARGTTVALYVVAILYLIWLVVVHRKAPARHFEQVAAQREDDLWIAAIAFAARYWHFLVLPCLILLLHEVMTAGTTAVPVLIVIAEIAGALAAAGLAWTLLDGFAARGVRLSDRTNRVMPGMETRLNAFVRPFVRLVRVLLAVLWLAVVLKVVGVLSLGDWFETRYGIDILGATTSLVVVVVMVFAAWLAIDTWVEYRLTPRASHVPTARERTLLALLRNAALVVILLFGLYYALLEVGISLAPLLASAGVIALAISWGSQKLVQDIITGLFIQLENAINVGDVVEAGGKTGVVEKLTVRSVSLRDVQGVYHLIPFSSVDSVSNHMKGFSYHVADIQIAYREDIDKAKAAMLAAYDEMAARMEWGTKLVGGIEWFGVEALAESAVVLRARLKTVPGEQWAIGRAYAEAVKRRFDAEGLEIPFPQRQVWLTPTAEAPPPPTRLQPTVQTRGSDAPTDADEQEAYDAQGDGDGR